MFQRKKKRIVVGIVTQPLGGNYGGVLQNYALQQVLNRMGYAPITLFLHLYYPLHRYLISYIWTAVLHCFGLAKGRVFPARPQSNRLLNSLSCHIISHNIKTIAPGYSSLSNEIIKRYKIDVLIVGSDQVWRPECNRTNLEDMFLRFAQSYKGKKIAYAASFGVDYWSFSEKQTNECSRLIQQFDAISVRELSGVSLCNKHLNRNDAQVVLDPTLLLNKEEYDRLCYSIKKNKNPFIFAYILDKSEETETVIAKESSKREMPVYQATSNDECGPTVEQWISLVRDASLVITDSFHGTVFSIIYHKPFITLYNANRGNARIMSLLEMFDLKGRLVSNDKIDIDEIDWNHVDEQMLLWRGRSLNFLKESLS